MGCGPSVVAEHRDVPQSGKARDGETGNGAQSSICSVSGTEEPYNGSGSVLDTYSNQTEPGEYQGAPPPLNEASRQQHLSCLGILDTEPEKRFDDITKLCCMVFKVPIALVSLVDQDRQWFKSKQGVPVCQTSRTSSFCAWTLLPANPEALVVENALNDARFRENPLVTGPPNIRFYAGCPLVCSNGQRLGSLCIIDSEPHTFDAKSCSVLTNMAEMVTREIEKDQMLAAQQSVDAGVGQQPKRIRALDSYSDAIMLVQPSPQNWSILYCNTACEGLLQVPSLSGQDANFWDVFEVMDGTGPSGSRNPDRSIPDLALQYADAVEKQLNFDVRVTFGRGISSMALQACTVQFRNANNSTVDSSMPQVGIPSFLANGDEAPNLYFAVVRDVGPATSGGRDRQPTFSLVEDSQGFEDICLGPLVGKGAFGRVYRGVWEDKHVAVKIIEYQEQEARLALEGLLSENLSHPNVVQTHKHMTRRSPMSQHVEDGEESALQLFETWLVLEFCNAGCLADAVQKGWFRSKMNPLLPNFPCILVTALEMASALDYLHSKGVLHIDFTGNNVLLAKRKEDPRGWTAKVSDFGLSRYISAEHPIITTRTHGTVTHMPPELLMEGSMSRAVDVYSFGVVCWEMLLGNRPYGGMTQSQVLHAVTCGKRLEVPANVPVPQRFKALINQCLARQPDKRPSFAQLVEGLKALQEAEEAGAADQQ